jgi:hypothetical protein
MKGEITSKCRIFPSLCATFRYFPATFFGAEISTYFSFEPIIETIGVAKNVTKPAGVDKEGFSAGVLCFSCENSIPISNHITLRGKERVRDEGLDLEEDGMETEWGWFPSGVPGAWGEAVVRCPAGGWKG